MKFCDFAFQHWSCLLVVLVCVLFHFLPSFIYGLFLFSLFLFLHIFFKFLSVLAIWGNSSVSHNGFVSSSCNMLKVFWMSLTFAGFGLVAISFCFLIFLIAPSHIFSLPATTSASCLCIFLHSHCSALPWIPLSSSLESFDYQFMNLFLLLVSV